MFGFYLFIPSIALIFTLNAMLLILCTRKIECESHRYYLITHFAPLDFLFIYYYLFFGPSTMQEEYYQWQIAGPILMEASSS